MSAVEDELHSEKRTRCYTSESIGMQLAPERCELALTEPTNVITKGELDCRILTLDVLRSELLLT
jgi:hypothetical protein